jgi:hypothetical protein
VRRRPFANVRHLLGFVLAVAALLAPLSASALLASSGAERPERPEITELDVRSFELGTPSRVPGIAAAPLLRGVAAPAPLIQREEHDPATCDSTADQLRWTVGHSTTSSIH